MTLRKLVGAGSCLVLFFVASACGDDDAASVRTRQDTNSSQVDQLAKGFQFDGGAIRAEPDKDFRAKVALSDVQEALRAYGPSSSLLKRGLDPILGSARFTDADYGEERADEKGQTQFTPRFADTPVVLAIWSDLSPEDFAMISPTTGGGLSADELERLNRGDAVERTTVPMSEQPGGSAIAVLDPETGAVEFFGGYST